MNFKKFISGVSALTIAASAFAAMAVTASAATYPALNEKKPFSNTTGTITADKFARWSYVPAQEANTQIVHEFDLYVADKDVVTLTYTKNSGTLGARFIFDAQSVEGTTVVRFTDSEHTTDGTQATTINSSTAYDRYATGAIAHVIITSNVGNNGYLTEHVIEVKNVGDRTLTNKPGKGNRTINARNLRSNSWGSCTLATTDPTLGSYVKGGEAYVKGVAATKIGMFESDEAAKEDTVTAFGADMDNLSGNLNIKVDETVGTCDTVLTGANVQLGIIAPGEHNTAVVRVY